MNFNKNLKLAVFLAPTRFILTGVLLLSQTALVASDSTHNTQNLADTKDHRLKEFNQIIDSFLGHNSEIKICDDETFLRRIYLDLTATLPEVAEIKYFRESKDPHKREQCIDKLLDSSDFEDYSIMKWCDRLRVKSEFPIRLWPNAVQAYTRYIEQCQRKNLPYDQFVRELLTASGSNFRHAPVNFYRAVSQHNPQGYATAVALTFLGQRLEQWPKMQQQNFIHWFEYVGLKNTREWKEEIVYFSANLSVSERSFTFPDGQSISLLSSTDPREVLAKWLIKTSPHQLQRNAVNRIWYEMLGHGLCARIDDLTPEDMKASHPVLQYLESFLLDQQWHTREIVALIAKSKLYQQDLSASKSYPLWAQYKVRRLEAEVIVDILQQVLGGSENYSSMIPEPFTFIPREEKSILLCDGSITSRTLELFGRSPRDTGEIQERNNLPSYGQQLQMLNSSSILNNIQQCSLLKNRKNAKDFGVAMDYIYLAVLSRTPHSQEKLHLQNYQSETKLANNEVMRDLLWALINCREFIYRH